MNTPAESPDKKSWSWLWMVVLLGPGYFLSAVVVRLVCLIFPPSQAVGILLVNFYLPVILLLQKFPHLEKMLIEMTDWLAGWFRP